MRVIIVGGGASGLVAAISARESGCQVTLLEKNKIVGKKLAITGNGKANISNENLSINKYQGDNSFINDVLCSFTLDDLRDFFLKIGIVTINKGDYIYPYSQDANSVVDALRNYAQKIGVKIKTENTVLSITKSDSFIVDTGYKYESDAVIIATGGQSYENTGSTGDGYIFAQSLGHNIIKTKPGLVPITVDDVITSASGRRIDSDIYFEDKKESGQLQITSYGLSGIPIFNLSNSIKPNSELTLDFIPEYSKEQVVNYIKKLGKDGFSITQILNSFFNSKICDVIIKKSNVKTLDTTENITKIAETIKQYQIKVKDILGFDRAQVTLGGIDTKEINPNTMESLLIPKLYCTGEVLDVTGICGGYNLHFAWATGYIAGSNIQNKNEQ